MGGVHEGCNGLLRGIYIYIPCILYVDRRKLILCSTAQNSSRLERFFHEILRHLRRENSRRHFFSSTPLVFTWNWKFIQRGDAPKLSVKMATCYSLRDDDVIGRNIGVFNSGMIRGRESADGTLPGKILPVSVYMWEFRKKVSTFLPRYYIGPNAESTGSIYCYAVPNSAMYLMKNYTGSHTALRMSRA